MVCVMQFNEDKGSTISLSIAHYRWKKMDKIALDFPIQFTGWTEHSTIHRYFIINS